MIRLIVCTGASIFLVLHLILTSAYSVFISSYVRESGRLPSGKNAVQTFVKGKVPRNSLLEAM
jgi:hypothetical protein